jgi:uncharacterized protein YaaN involved in tellurite resistance
MPETNDYTFDAPSLTFDEAPAPQAPQTAPAPQEDPAADLTPEEQAQVDAFVDKIDMSNATAIMNYGAGTQKKMSSFTEKALEDVRTKDMDEIGSMITDLVSQLGSLEIEDEKKTGLFGFLAKKKNNAEALKTRYDKVEHSVETIKNQLEERQVQLMKDSAMLDRMYDANRAYFKELTMYIAAGKKKLDQVRTGDLARLQEKAAASGLPEDAQAARDLAAMCERFDKKLSDLQLTRTISLQMAPQIRMVQASDNVMAEKIQSTIVNTIPLWKNQMVLALGIEHSVQAAKAQREVTDMTNTLLRKNADTLKMATVETAKESERGIVDIETLRHTNESLISTLDEVMAIQQQGREKRAAAQKELAAIEDQLSGKLLEAAAAQRAAVTGGQTAGSLKE